jgi:hypothetical protein
MSFSVNGITFTPGTAFDHATSMLNYMNGLLQGQNLPILSANNGNALWWTLLGQGSLDASFDQIVEQATASLNVAMADDQQIINLLPIAGTELLPATYSVITFTVTAGTGICNIPSGTLVPFSQYNFRTLTTLAVPISGVQNVQAICDTLGPITVPEGAIFLTSLPGINNLVSITNLFPAIPGNSTETPAQARQRIIAGKNIGVGIDGAITAIRSLPGVGQANVYWNYLTSGYLPISGLAFGLPPRTSWILVQNPVPDIAITYLSYMTLPTSGVNFQPAFHENFVTLAGQNFPVFYDLAGTQEIYAKVFVDQNQVLQNGYQIVLRNTILALNGNFGIGQRVSSEVVSVALQNFQPATILGVLLSLTSGGTYGMDVQPSFNSIPFFLASGIQIVLQ